VTLSYKKTSEELEKSVNASVTTQFKKMVSEEPFTKDQAKFLKFLMVKKNPPVVEKEL